MNQLLQFKRNNKQIAKEAIAKYKAAKTSTIVLQHELLVDEQLLLDSDTTRARMHRILNGIEPSKLDQLIIRVKDIFNKRKSR